MKSSSTAKPKPWFVYGLSLFALWVALLVAALLLEHTGVVEFVFSHPAGGIAYLVIQLGLTLAALLACSIAFVRAPGPRRIVLALPILVLVFYGLMFLSGPG